MAQQPWPDIEREILEYWKRERIFEQSLDRNALQGEYVFFEGPPTANAPPGIHHVESRTFKDIIPRYKTMRGFRVRRKAGWDTHGLPVELQLEKKLGLKTKKDIEAYGVAAFNAACRDSVWEFKEQWERLTERIGFWLDQRDPYVTYESSYIESIWWFLKEAHRKGLLTRDFKSVWYCPRCQTPLSSHEVALGYKDDTEDPAVTVKFEVQDSRMKPPTSARTFFLAWTTTPWTLPGNVALAVHAEVDYAVVRNGDEYIILARPLVARVLGESAEVVQTIRGSDLVGATYAPLYPTATETWTDHPAVLHSVLPAEFVALDEGTGIVHIASAFGQEDFELSKTHGIPPLLTVDVAGVMIPGFPGAGKFVKDADADVRADLQARGLLFRDERIRHTYPFCWRCNTALLAYARPAWYIRMSKLREEIQRSNATVAWRPEHIRAGRMGEWLRDLKDWALTRERWWGTPLPVWQCDRCGRDEVIGSFEELLARVPVRNRFILMRHGEAESNARGIINAKLETSEQYPLTPDGRARVIAATEQLKGVGITRIIASPYHRMRQTAESVSASVGVPVTYDDRLREIDLPDFDGKAEAEHAKHFCEDPRERTLAYFTKKVGANETWNELARRMLTTLKDIDAQHEGQTILICSHGDPLFLLQWAFSGRTRAGIDAMPYPSAGGTFGSPADPLHRSTLAGSPRAHETRGFAGALTTRTEMPWYPEFSTPEEFRFTGALVNDRGELDVHRPFIDAITWPCGGDGCGGTMERYPEVVDVWLDSGAMSFAQDHYPFERPVTITDDADHRADDADTRMTARAPILYPANYISEAIDQTRGWFYTLLATATVLGWETPYRNVIVLGHLLDKDGQKMSKSKGNVVNPWTMIDRYGADVVRWYMCTVNQPWDAKLFDEADLRRMSGKPFGTLRNVLAFWELHGGNAAAAWSEVHVLDAWLRARFASLHHDVTQYLDAYEITEAARAVGDAIDDLSTWWLRRSRERLKAGDAGARATFTAALQTTAILLAPFAPFTAEHVWQTLRKEGSVHLTMWDDHQPQTSDRDDAIRTSMGTARQLVRLGLDAREAAGVPVRQPLAQLIASTRYEIVDDFLALVREECNVKTVVFDATYTGDVQLDTTLTPELKREGMIRELVRQVNDLRKKAGLTPSDRIRVTYATDDAEIAQAIEEHRSAVERGTNAAGWNPGSPANPQTIEFDARRVAVALEAIR